MRNRFDYIAKQLGQSALSSSGITVTHDEITSAAQYADLRHEPDPARQAARDRLGLLGRLAAVRCIIEVYSGSPSAGEFRACLAKHLAAWQQRTREARADNQREPPPPDDADASFLWIIAAGVPTTLLTKLRLEAAPGLPAGVYLFGDDVLRVGIVIASKLPRDSTTLLVRLMAAGPLLVPATAEVIALPTSAYERTIAEPVLLRLQQVLGQDPSDDPNEQEFAMVMLKSWEETRAEGQAEGLAKGRAQGRLEERTDAVLTVLRMRGIAITNDARDRIMAEKDLEQLQRWFEKAIVASSIDDVLDDSK